MEGSERPGAGCQVIKHFRQHGHVFSEPRFMSP